MTGTIIGQFMLVIFVSGLSGPGTAFGSGWDFFNSQKVENLNSENTALKSALETARQKAAGTEKQLEITKLQLKKHLRVQEQILEEAHIRSEEIIKSAACEAENIRRVETDKLNQKLSLINDEICFKQNSLLKLQKSHETLCSRIFGDGFEDYTRVDFRLRGYEKIYSFYREELESPEVRNSPLYIMLLGKYDFCPIYEEDIVILDGVRFPSVFERIYSYIATRTVPGLDNLDQESLVATAKLADFLGLNQLTEKLKSFMKNETWGENKKTFTIDGVSIDFIEIPAGSYSVPISVTRNEMLHIDRNFLISKTIITRNQFRQLTGAGINDTSAHNQYALGISREQAANFLLNLNEQFNEQGAFFQLPTPEQLKVARSLAYAERDPMKGSLDQPEKPVFSDYEFDCSGRIYKEGKFSQSKSSLSGAYYAVKNKTGFRIVLAEQISEF